MYVNNTFQVIKFITDEMPKIMITVHLLVSSTYFIYLLVSSTYYVFVIIFICLLKFTECLIMLMMGLLYY